MDTITRHGLKSVPIKKLRLPGDVATRRRSQHVLDLGRSFALTGGEPLAPIIVEWGTWKLIAGADRIAACLNRGVKEVDVLTVEGEPDALAELALIENAMRRHSAAEQEAAIAKLVAMHTAREQAGAFPDVPDDATQGDDRVKVTRSRGGRKRGSRKARTQAYADVAAATGKTPKAVKSAAHRAKKKAERAAAPAEKPAPVIETFGLAVPEAILDATSKQHSVLTEMANKLTALKSALTRLENEAGMQFQGLKTALDTAAREARGELPASVCPYCKDPDGTARRRDGCNACGGAGWLRARAVAHNESGAAPTAMGLPPVNAAKGNSST